MTASRDEIIWARGAVYANDMRMNTQIEKEADRKAWLIVIVLTCLFCVVNATTLQMEMRRATGGGGDSTALIWLYETSSAIGLLAMTAMISAWIDRFPLSLSHWKRVMPAYVLGFLLFSAGHVLIMVAIRSVVYPMISPGPYEFGLLHWEPWLYEIRKDFLSYVLILLTFIVARQMAHLSHEIETTRQDAAQTGRLTLKCGGRTIFLAADEILSAKAAANYVEIQTDTGLHLARLTMRELERLLTEAGGNHLRVHRSWIIRRDALRELVPTGEGDARAVLVTGQEVPVGRQYKRALLEA